MIKIGINGFGRIGRALARINLKYKKYTIAAINDIDPDINNLAYLLKYDSTYGKLATAKVGAKNGFLMVDDARVRVYSESTIDKVPWKKHGVDVIVDATGVYKNVCLSRKLVKKQVKKVIITHSPDDMIDMTIMKGVNEDEYDKKRHHVISSSICDANAVAPFFKIIDKNFRIISGTITTLHPWLSYQNLLDGPVTSVSSPGHFWTDYALGRASVGNLIAKKTTLVPALSKVMPKCSEVLKAISFRVPTSIVAVADGTFLLGRKTTIDEISKAVMGYTKKYNDVLFFEDKSLISTDYLACEYAAVLDKRWLLLTNGNLLKFVLWYDNEWGYSKLAYDLIGFVLR